MFDALNHLIQSYVGVQLELAQAHMLANPWTLFMARFIIFFWIISAGGWVWETIFCSIMCRRLMKRGFLFGPHCPIYGCGAVLVYMVLPKDQGLVVTFMAGAFLATMLEYVTSVVMERAFGKRWWDYSMFPFNLNGRICLGASLVFGLFSVAIVHLVGPLCFAAIHNLPATIQLMWACGILCVGIVDIGLSVALQDERRQDQLKALIHSIKRF